VGEGLIRYIRIFWSELTEKGKDAWGTFGEEEATWHEENEREII